MGFKVGSGDLERGASSNVGGEGTGVDTATSAPFSSQPPAPAVAHPFHALKEKCSLKIEVFSKFKDRFQFLEGTGLVFPERMRRLVPLLMGKFVFMRLHFHVALDSPSIPSSWSFFTI